MKNNLILLFTLFGVSLLAQNNLTVINATSDIVDILDGDDFEKGSWTIMPEIRPDVYTTSNKDTKVVFYTDIDSISFNISPGGFYDFIILLNGKDSAFTRIVYVPTYLETLKKAGKYNLADKRKIPKFSYQSTNDPNLMALKEGFKLDSIAGQANEVSRILNLMHWIHNLIPHDGQSNNPVTRNAVSMINVCKTTERGLNCRMLATVLNECYLSLGFKSRFVTCLPKDSLNIDNDCHVINMVFAESLNKWIWIDPSFDAYVMNEKGEMLGIAEVRERLINDKPLIINPDANWNHKSSTVKEEYLYEYMAKNLYMLECPVSSRYDTETKVEGKEILYVKLIPLDYFDQSPDKKEKTNEKTGTKYINYKTNNPGLFWETTLE